MYISQSQSTVVIEKGPRGSMVIFDDTYLCMHVCVCIYIYTYYIFFVCAYDHKKNESLIFYDTVEETEGHSVK